MASLNAHALLGNGIRGACDRPNHDILDAEDALVARIEHRDRLWRSWLPPREGLLLAHDCDVRRGHVLIHLIRCDERGGIAETIDTVRLSADQAYRAVAAIGQLQPDEHGDWWAEPIFECLKAVAS